MTRALLIATAAASLFAQAVRPKVDVVSIKPSLAERDMISARVGGQSVTLENYPLREMIGAAYGVRLSELIGGPSWIASTRYNISAKAEKAADNRALWRMIQSVLEDRFKLRTHRERREFPVFDLSIANPGRLPPARSGVCIDYDASLPPPGPTPDGKPPRPRCGGILMTRAEPAGFQLTGHKVRILELVGRLTDLLGRHVID